MERCEYCGASFIKGESCDIGVGFMQVTADEPSCDCYESAYCESCCEEVVLGYLEQHQEECHEDM